MSVCVDDLKMTLTLTWCAVFSDYIRRGSTRTSTFRYQSANVTISIRYQQGVRLPYLLSTVTCLVYKLSKPCSYLVQYQGFIIEQG